MDQSLLRYRIADDELHGRLLTAVTCTLASVCPVPGRSNFMTRRGY